MLIQACGTNIPTMNLYPNRNHSILKSSFHTTPLILISDGFNKITVKVTVALKVLNLTYKS